MNAFLTYIGGWSGLRVLLVIYDSKMSEIYKVYMESKNVEVVYLSSNDSVKQLLDVSFHPFDAVVVDRSLDEEGFRLIDYIQKKMPNAAIVLLSETVEPKQLLRAFEAGIHDYICKPVNLDLLWLKLSKAIHQLRLINLSSKQNAELKKDFEQKLKQQELAKYLFDSVINELNQRNLAINTWIKPLDIFNGDVILHCQGLDGSWYFLLADAIGEGVAPAISLMPLMHSFKSMANKSLAVSNIVFALNEILNSMLPNDYYIAAVVARIFPEKKELEVWNGGIPSALLLSEDSQILHNLTPKHVPLGLHGSQEINVNTEVIDLNDVGSIILFSDGVTNINTSNGINISVEEITQQLNLKSNNPFMGVESLLSNAQTMDDLSVCLVDCKKLFAEYAQQASFVDYKNKANSFRVNYMMNGLSMVNTDIPKKLIDLLKTQKLPQFFLQNAFTIFTELYVNALEHGVLKLKSSLKEKEDGFIRYCEQKAQRILLLKEQDFIEVSIQWSGEEEVLYLEIADSGSGFMKSDLNTSKSVICYGRGFELIDKLSRKIEIIAPGNRIRVELALHN